MIDDAQDLAAQVQFLADVTLARLDAALRSDSVAEIHDLVRKARPYVKRAIELTEPKEMEAPSIG